MGRVEFTLGVQDGEVQFAQTLEFCISKTMQHIIHIATYFVGMPRNQQNSSVETAQVLSEEVQVLHTYQFSEGLRCKKNFLLRTTRSLESCRHIGCNSLTESGFATRAKLQEELADSSLRCINMSEY